VPDEATSANVANWFPSYQTAAARTDQFTDAATHLRLLAAGLLGEAGSVAAELKKAKRELDAYPGYRGRLIEEVGDVLWYFARICSLVDERYIPDSGAEASLANGSTPDPVTAVLRLGSAVGRLALVAANGGPIETPLLNSVWIALVNASRVALVDLEEASKANTAKISSRWPTSEVHAPLFDDNDSEEDQIPRRLDFEFRELRPGNKTITLIRCNGLNVGDRLTDNSVEPDYYRYHDVFHLSYAAHLGWSPVTRALLLCKRKGRPLVDEVQDGQRALIIEEAVSAIVFARAKKLNMFAGLKQVDFDLLKMIQEFVRGYEVDTVPLWQWQRAILNGYDVFRVLCEHKGGHVTLDLSNRTLIVRRPGEPVPAH
jgi:NTP pyrophosphatase (non-canonical NTP hydrolase)